MKKLKLKLFACLSLALVLAASVYAADLTQTAANVVPDAATVQHASGIPGEAFSAGAPLYLKVADGKLYKCLNDSAAHATCVGIAEATGVVGQRTFYQTSGLINVGATLAVGETYVISANAGKIAPIGDLATSGYVTYLGVAVSTSQINLQINATGIVHY